jgi:hypothetical protein
MAAAFTHLASISLAVSHLKMATGEAQHNRYADSVMREVEKLICHHGLLPSKHLILATRDSRNE